jgi:hypothetical protein
MVLLDGKHVANDQIDPAKHKFIGTFRPPHFPSGIIACGCGSLLHTLEQSNSHWQSGHMDTPQYVTIKHSDLE